MLTTVLVGIFCRKHFDAFGDIFLKYCLGFWGDISDLPVTRGTVVTVTMDTGGNFDCWLRGTLVTVAMDMVGQL